MIRESAFCEEVVAPDQKDGAEMALVQSRRASKCAPRLLRRWRLDEESLQTRSTPKVQESSRDGRTSRGHCDRRRFGSNEDRCFGCFGHRRRFGTDDRRFG